jgi:hypothetical protein
MNKIKVLLCIVISLWIVGCNQPIPNPELKDPIYLDIQSQISQKSAAIEAELKVLAEKKSDLAMAVPQTNQSKWAEKRVYESEYRLKMQKQEQMYWKLKLATRKQEAQKEYLQSFYAKTPWPDPKKHESWRKTQGIPKKVGTWSYERRMTELGLPFKSKRNPSAATPAAKPPPPKGGGH